MKQLLGLLLLVGFVGAFFWWIVAAVVVVVVVRLAWTGYLQARDELTSEQLAAADECRRLVAAADLEHAAVTAGDDGGIYGRYPPA